MWGGGGGGRMEVGDIMMEVGGGEKGGGSWRQSLSSEIRNIDREITLSLLGKIAKTATHPTE